MIKLDRFSLKAVCTISLVFVGLFNCNAQIRNSDSLVFSIDNEPVYKAEFLKQYRKNSSASVENQNTSLKDYAELYLRYKLKVQAAKDSGMDTLSSFLSEYNRYRKQLADKYISNGKVTQDMVDEIYHRMTTEVNASHILLSVSPEARPADTLEAYNTAIDLLKKIKQGESFEDLALTYSKDPSVRTNKGNLGWFKAYKMVYPFENAAYEIEVGEVSEPVRTKFGYHIIKKNAERLSKGKIKVAHIMKRHVPNDTTEAVKNEIFKIYDKIMNGEDFGNLAKQFSDHQPTASKGGELAPFGIGDMNSVKFEEKAFNLDENQSISEPFKTKFGWHIIKYIGNIPVEPIGKIEQEVVRKIKTSDRSKRLISNIKKDLMKIYNVNINYELLSSLEERIDESIISYKWKYSNDENDEANSILQIDKKKYSLKAFLNYIQKQQRSLEGTSIVEKINSAIDKFTYAKLISIHNKNLENISPEFASEIKTYYDGLLLFEIMEQKIWKPVQADTVALEKYYKENRDKFINETSIDGILVSGANQENINEIKKLLGKDSLQKIEAQFPKSIFKTLNKVEINSSFLPYELRLEIENARVYKHNGQFICVYITEIYPPKVLEFKSVRGKVIDQLQKQKEEDWIAELKSQYDIYMNRGLIENLSQSLEK
jgi:peptidyl-prolyl cis-trans isomerase SurA